MARAKFSLKDCFAIYDPTLKEWYRKLEQARTKTQVIKNQLDFLKSCKKQNLIPKGFRIRRKNFNSKSEEKILASAEISLLNNQIATLTQKIKLLNESIASLTINVYATVSNEDFRNIDNHLARWLQKKNSAHLETLSGKLLRLRSEKNGCRSTQSRHTQQTTPVLGDQSSNVNNFVNLTDVCLNTATEEILSMGKSYALPHNGHNLMDNIIRLSNYTKSNKELQAKTIHEMEKVCGPIQHANLREYALISQLRKEQPDSILTAADKGGKLVLMNKQEYSDKMNTLIDGKYQELQKDPSNLIVATIRRYLKQQAGWDMKEIDKVAPLHPTTPTIHGQPKLHKKDIPLRPVINQKGSCCSGLGKFVTEKITNLIDKPKSYIKNSQAFVEHIAELNDNMEDWNDTTMLSLDVQDMFTNIDINTALSKLESKLNLIPDPVFHQSLKMTKDQCLYLIKLILNNNFFQHDNKLYKQTEGLAMGSSLSPLLACLVMEDIEQRINRKYATNIKLWYRYVDDIFLIWKGQPLELAAFLDDVNSFDDHIKFTHEMESHHQLNFLQVTVTHTHSFSTTIYQKPTSGSGLLPFKSSHPLQLKISTATQKLRSIETLCTQSHDRLRHTRQLTTDLINLGYPKKILNIIFRKNKRQKAKSSQRPRFLPLHFDPLTFNATKELRSISCMTKIAWKNQNSILPTYRKPRLPSRNLSRKGVIYVIPCSCKKLYIGETKRTAAVRIKEHKYNISKENINSKIFLHLKENPSHAIQWDATFIIDTEEHATCRKQKEAVYIFLNKSSCLSDVSIDFEKEWRWVIDKYKHKKLWYGLPMYVL